MGLQSWTWLGDWRDTRELALSLASPPKDPARWQPSASREEGLARTRPCRHAGLRLSASRTVRNTFLVFRLHALVRRLQYVVTATQWDQYNVLSMFSGFFLHFFTHLLWTSHFLHFNSFLCNGFLHSFLPWFLHTSSFVLFWWMYLFFYYISN